MNRPARDGNFEFVVQSVKIKPGNTVTGAVVFDIPKGQKITKLELHDLGSSGGVTVTVS